MTIEMQDSIKGKGKLVSIKKKDMTQAKLDTDVQGFSELGFYALFGLQVVCKCDLCLDLFWPEVLCFDVWSSTGPV